MAAPEKPAAAVAATSAVTFGDSLGMVGLGLPVGVRDLAGGSIRGLGPAAGGAENRLSVRRGPARLGRRAGLRTADPRAPAGEVVVAAHGSCRARRGIRPPGLERVAAALRHLERRARAVGGLEAELVERGLQGLRVARA